MDSKKAWQSTVGHEITHVLEGSEHYEALKSALFDYAESKGAYQSKYDSISELYKNVPGANIEAELTAELVGEYLFTDEAFVKQLSSKNRSVFEKIYDEIKYLLKVATAGSKEARQLEKIKHEFDLAYKDTKKAADEGGNIKYSLCEFDDGQRFVDVVTEQKQFDGLSTKEKIDLATKILKSKFQGKVIGIDNKAFVNGSTIDEYTHPAKHIEADIYDAKLRASPELDNLMDAGFNFRNAPDGADGHNHVGAIDFSYFDIIFKIGNQYYQGIINIKNIPRGKLLKDITKIENITENVTSRYGESPSYAFLRDASTNSIPQNEDLSTENAKNSLSEEKSKSAYNGNYAVPLSDLKAEAVDNSDVDTSESSQADDGSLPPPVSQNAEANAKIYCKG